MEEIRAFYLENKVLKVATFVIKSESGVTVHGDSIRMDHSGMVDLSQTEGKFKDGETVWMVADSMTVKRPGIPGKKSPTSSLVSTKFIYRENSPYRANFEIIELLPKQFGKEYDLLFDGIERYFDDGMDDEVKPVQVDGIYYYLNPDEMTGSVAENPAKYRGAVNIPESFKYEGDTYRVNTICDIAFDQCKELTKVTIPKTVTSIGAGAFDGCSNLASVEIPEGVPGIREWTFTGCKALHSVIIPNSVDIIGLKAFDNCTNLTRIVVNKTTPPYVEDDNTFDEVDKSGCTVYVPEGCKQNYKKNRDWQDFIILES